MIDDPTDREYPSWLGPLLLRGELPIDDAQVTTMTAFLESHTLHDSSWIGLWCDPAGHAATAAFQWDSVWSGIPYSSSWIANWPILLIVFPRVAHVSFSDKNERWMNATIAGAETVVLSNEERGQLLDVLVAFRRLPDSAAAFTLDTGIARTFIGGIDGHRLTIVHGEEIRLLCFDRTGERLPIPGLQDR